MQKKKKKEKFLNKIVKKDYNNELEMILEKKSFDESAKNLLLSILYKIEASYKDYKKTKRNVMSKEEYIKRFIQMIQENCDNMTICKMNSKEVNILGDKTFLVDKENKRIICYPIERKLLYCIAKISKKDAIIKKDYPIIWETLSNAINIGNNIEFVEPLRDFNGYSWTTIPREIESIEHNLIYQNLLLLVGNEFMNNWINNKEFIIDYMELFNNRLEKLYGKKEVSELIELLKEISVYLEIKFDKKVEEKMLKQKKLVEKELEQMEDNEAFVEKVTEEKIKIINDIKIIDETINNKHLLEEEYEKRNEILPLEEKIFSMRILAKMMADERVKKLEKIEKLNELLNPQKYVRYKKELEEKEKYLSLADEDNVDEKIENLKLKIQKLFIKCFDKKIEKCDSKQEMLKLIYEFRYYLMLPYSYENAIYEEKKLQKEVESETKKVLEKAHKLKVIERFSKQEDVDYELLKCLFQNRNINIEDIEVKLIKEKENYYIQVFDGNGIGEKKELPNKVNMNKKDLAIRFNKKVKAFY